MASSLAGRDDYGLPLKPASSARVRELTMGNFSIPSPLNLGRQRQPISLFVALGLIGVASVRAAAPATSADFDKSVAPFLAQHCNRCHDEKKHKGEFRIDNLSRDFLAGSSANKWAEVLERISTGEMPPKGEKKPTAAEASRVAEWLAARLKEGEAARLKIGRAHV